MPEVFFFPENDYVDHTIKKGYWNPERKVGVTTHFSGINSPQCGEIMNA